MSSQIDAIFVHYSLLMLVVFSLAIGFSAFAPMEKAVKKSFLFSSLGILAMLTMFRGPFVGNDTQNYIAIFESIARTSDLLGYIGSSAIEPGYIIWNWLISRVFCDPQALFVLSGLFIYCSIGRFVYKWAPAPGLIVCAIVAMHLFDGYLSTMRQTIALAILLFAFDYACSKKPIQFVLLCLVAMQFHMAALLFVSVYPVINFSNVTTGKLSKTMMAILVVCAIGILMIAFDKMLSVLLSLFPKYQYYLGGSSVDGEVRLATVLNIAVYSLMIIVPKFFNVDEKRCVALPDTSIHRLALFNVIVFILSTNATIFTRFTGLFSLFSICDFAASVQRLDKRENMALSLVSVGLLYLYGLIVAIARTPEWYTTYPYVFCWM